MNFYVVEAYFDTETLFVGFPCFQVLSWQGRLAELATMAVTCILMGHDDVVFAAMAGWMLFWLYTFADAAMENAEIYMTRLFCYVHKHGYLQLWHLYDVQYSPRDHDI